MNRKQSIDDSAFENKGVDCERDENEQSDEDDDEWIDMVEHACESLPTKQSSDIQFVNLLQNPESFTGYSGPSARRVWEAIQQVPLTLGPLFSN